MKISKSKRQLAQLLIEAGVKQFPEEANWAAQCSKDNCVSFYGGERPRHNRGELVHYGDYYGKQHDVKLTTLITNWHQTVLTRAEFDQLVAESAEQGKPDADGWIEWKGGDCPVQRGTLVDVKYANGVTNIGVSALTRITHSDHTCGTQSDLLATNWDGESSAYDIVAYHLHKPEQSEPQHRESVTRATHEPVTAPTLDQLLQDYRNASDFAAAKQAEAGEAAKMREERWGRVQKRACELGVRISIELVVDAEMRESELVITDWRDLRIGDEIEVVESNKPRCNGLVGVVSRFDEADHQKPIRVIFDGNERDYDWPTKWRFIRRP